MKAWRRSRACAGQGGCRVPMVAVINFGLVCMCSEVCTHAMDQWKLHGAMFLARTHIHIFCQYSCSKSKNH